MCIKLRSKILLFFFWKLKKNNFVDENLNRLNKAGYMSMKCIETKYFEYKAVFAVFLKNVTVDAISETAKRRVKHLA